MGSNETHSSYGSTAGWIINPKLNLDLLNVATVAFFVLRWYCAVIMLHATRASAVFASTAVSSMTLMSPREIRPFSKKMTRKVLKSGLLDFSRLI